MLGFNDENIIEHHRLRAMSFVLCAQITAVVYIQLQNKDKQ